jgi:hypothetical protein
MILPEANREVRSDVLLGDSLHLRRLGHNAITIGLIFYFKMYPMIVTKYVVLRLRSHNITSSNTQNVMLM